jgi:dinuclear metal center YbgI/SA1388 family protein
VASRDDIVSFCDELLDVEAFEDYGPNGLQVPGRGEVAKVATGVTANLEFLAAAVESGADLLIAHHGLFFGDGGGGLSEQLAARLRLVLAAEASVAAYHLPLDAHRRIGNNALLCAELGLEPDPQPFGLVKGRPIGVIGTSREGLGAAELVERLRSLTGREPLHFDSGPETVRRVGIVTGSGASVLAEAAAARLDAFVTGEPAEHAMGDASELGLHFVAAGHYATEVAGVRRLGETIADRFGIDHEFVDVPNPI